MLDYIYHVIDTPLILENSNDQESLVRKVKEYNKKGI